MLYHYVQTASGSASTISLQSSSSMDVAFRPRRLPDNSWHFQFQIPWQKTPSDVIRKLETGKRPTRRERLEIIRLIVSEVLTICPTPGKKHLSEIARKMTMTYPVMPQGSLSLFVGHFPVSIRWNFLPRNLKFKMPTVVRQSTRSEIHIHGTT